MARFSEEERKTIWDMREAGVPVKRIAKHLDRQNSSVRRFIADHGGTRPTARERSELRLSLAEREEISRGLAAGLSIRAIAGGLERVGAENPILWVPKMSSDGFDQAFRGPALADETGPWPYRFSTSLSSESSSWCSSVGATETSWPLKSSCSDTRSPCSVGRWTDQPCALLIDPYLPG
jgi:hypothetical protein